MKFKNTYIFLIVLFIANIFMMSVDAKTYSQYNVGDEISVNVNDTKQYKFLVVENNNDKVKAIYKGSLGNDIKWPENITTATCTFDGSVVDNALKERTADWNNVSNITLPTANDIVGEFDYTDKSKIEILGSQTNPEGHGVVHLENLTNVPFYALNNAKGTNYFTNSVVTISDDGIASSGCEIYVYGHALVDFPYFYFSTFSEAGIRPIVTVSKNYIVGGVKTTEVDTIWEEFVEKYKHTEFLDYYKSITEEEYAEYAVKITSTDNSLRVQFNTKELSSVTNFTYNDGIITYVPSETIEQKILDGVWIANCLEALSDLKGYNLEKLEDWLNSKTSFSLANDGIEFSKEVYNETIEGYDGSVEFISSFKLDIVNGIKFLNEEENNEEKEDITKNDDNKKENVKNPDTGLSITYLILLPLIIGVGIYFYIKSKKYNKFPQV